jgi:hypothetical protein
MVTKPNNKLNQNRQHETITFKMEHRIVQQLCTEGEQKTKVYDYQITVYGASCNFGISSLYSGIV